MKKFEKISHNALFGNMSDDIPITTMLRILGAESF